MRKLKQEYNQGTGRLKRFTAEGDRVYFTFMALYGLHAEK